MTLLMEMFEVCLFAGRGRSLLSASRRGVDVHSTIYAFLVLYFTFIYSMYFETNRKGVKSLSQEDISVCFLVAGAVSIDVHYVLP